MKVEPFVHFSGQCEQAIKLYHDVLGAKVTALMHFSDMPKAGGDRGHMMPPDHHVMYSRLEIGDTVLMASDGCPENQPSTAMASFELCISVKDEAEAEQVFAAMSKGGTVRMPLMKTFFSPKYGQLTDPFGVNWMIIVPMAM